MRPGGPLKWRDLYTAAIEEVDPGKLLPRIYSAKLAIWDRIECVGESSNSAERAALERAMILLCKLQGLYFEDIRINEFRSPSPRAQQVNLQRLQHCVAGD